MPGKASGKPRALALARFGADVAICDMHGDRLPSVKAQLLKRRVDAAMRPNSMFETRTVLTAWLGNVVEELGAIDVLVNNAGGGFHSLYSGVSPKGEGVLIAENFSTVTNCVRYGV